MKPVKLVILQDHGLKVMEKKGEEVMEKKKTMFTLSPEVVKVIEDGTELNDGYTMLMRTLTEAMAGVEKYMDTLPPNAQADIMEVIKTFHMVKDLTDILHKKMIVVSKEDKKYKAYTHVLDSLLTILVTTLAAYAQGPTALGKASDKFFEYSTGHTTDEAKELVTNHVLASKGTLH